MNIRKAKSLSLEAIVLIISGVVLWAILCNFLVDSSKSFETSVQKRCDDRKKETMNQTTKEVAPPCCWAPEELLPYMLQFVKSSKIKIVLVIVFWFFGIVFVRATDKLVKRVITSYGP